MRRKYDCELMTLTFDLGCHRDCQSYALGTLSEYQVQILVILRLFVFYLWAIAVGQHGSD